MSVASRTIPVVAWRALCLGVAVAAVALTQTAIVLDVAPPYSPYGSSLFSDWLGELPHEWFVWVPTVATLAGAAILAVGRRKPHELVALGRFLLWASVAAFASLLVLSVVAASQLGGVSLQLGTLLLLGAVGGVVVSAVASLHIPADG